MGNCCGRKDMIVIDKKPIIRRRSSIFNENITKFSDYKKKYEYIYLLNTGAFGRVKLFRDKYFKNLKYAIKTIKKDIFNTHNIQCIVDEVKILRRIDHPNIVKYFETYEEDNYIHIVMEFITGDDLVKFLNKQKNKFDRNNKINNININDNIIIYEEKKTNVIFNEAKKEKSKGKNINFKITNYSDKIQNKKSLIKDDSFYFPLSEQELCLLITSILKAISFLHYSKIIHRDIKPENILIPNPEDLSSVKIIDFGLSVLNKKEEKYRVGSPYYMAPEMIEGNYSKASDMWSIGVILYEILTGKHPFEGNKDIDIYRRIKIGSYDKEILNRNRIISQDLRDFVFKLLLIEEDKRIKSEDAFDHPWINKFFNTQTNSTTFINESLVNSLKTFSKNNILQKEILFYLAKISSEKEISELKKAFDQLDCDNTGIIRIKQIENLFFKLNINATKVIIL